MEIIITVPSADLIIDAVKLAYDTDITVYDAIYVSLSLKVKGRFITADKSLYKKISKVENCRLLSNWLVSND